MRTIGSSSKPIFIILNGTTANMATRTWNTSKDAIWNVGVNWVEGSTPADGDDVVFGPPPAFTGYFTVTMVKGVYNLNSLRVSGNGTLAMNGSSLSAGAVTLTRGTIKNGALTVGSMFVNGLLGAAVLDGTSVNGQITVGSTGEAHYLTVRNGLSMNGGIALSGGSLLIDGTQTITGAAITVANNGTSEIASAGASASQVTLSGGSLEVGGRLNATSLSLNEFVHVSGTGYLNLIGANVPTTFSANARIAVDAGGKVLLSQSMTTDALTNFASKVTRPDDGTVLLSGTIDNTGRTLDLTSGSTLSKALSYSPVLQNEDLLNPQHIRPVGLGGVVSGGTILNTGATVYSDFGSLYGVALRGLFASYNPAFTTLNVRDSFTVLNADGSAGTLDLANAGTVLSVDSVGGITGGTFTLSNMTLLSAGIMVQVATVLDASFTADFTHSGGIGGTVVNKGTVIAEKGIYLNLGYGNDRINYTLAGTPAAGNFENDGTVSLLAGSRLDAAAGFVNKGVVRLADNVNAQFASTALGTISVKGANTNLTFLAKGATGSLVGLNSDDRLFLQTGGAGSAAATVSGRTLTLSEDGAAVATFDLGQDGWNTSDFATSISSGIVMVTNTHGAGGTTPVDDGAMIVSGGTTGTTGTAGIKVIVTDTGTVLSHGADRISGGTGATSVSTLGSGATVVGGAGALTVTGGTGSNTVYAGAGGLTYQGGSGSDTVIGLGKLMTATGGTGGGAFFGGGNATITAGAGGDLNLIIGGSGDRLYAAGPKGVLFGTSGGDVLMSSAADTGTSVFFGASGTGHMTFITGAGSDLLALGQDTNDVTLGSGHAVIFGNGGSTSHTAITAGSGSLDLMFSGADTVLTIAAGGARSFNLYGLGAGSNHVHLQGYSSSQAADAIANQRSIGGGTQLSLADGSVISLIGVLRADAALFS